MIYILFSIIEEKETNENNNKNVCSNSGCYCYFRIHHQVWRKGQSNKSILCLSSSDNLNLPSNPAHSTLALLLFYPRLECWVECGSGSILHITWHIRPVVRCKECGKKDAFCMQRILSTNFFHLSPSLNKQSTKTLFLVSTPSEAVSGLVTKARLFIANSVRALTLATLI